MTDIDAARIGEDLADDARRLFQEMDRTVAGVAQTTGECRPPLDVLDTGAGIEVIVDLPGVSLEAVRVCVRHNTLVVVGAKVPVAGPSDARFHVAERSSGRFVRGVRLPGPVDASRAEARVERGLLRVLLPRLPDRRGQVIHIPVTRQ